jgi:hypothetical protein
MLHTTHIVSLIGKNALPLANHIAMLGHVVPPPLPELTRLPSYDDDLFNLVEFDNLSEVEYEDEEEQWEQSPKTADPEQAALLASFEMAH